MKQNVPTHAGPICATDNGASIYIEALRNGEKHKTDSGALMYTDLLHAGNPAGPAGVFDYHASFHHGVMSYSKNRKRPGSSPRRATRRDLRRCGTTTRRGSRTRLMQPFKGLCQEPPLRGTVKR